MRPRIHRSLLAAALVLATAPALAQDTFSQTVFFGDSLSDSGHFRPTLVQIAGPQAGVLGRFTTNPGLVWAEFLADFYGTAAVSNNQGGTDYAVGGARVGVDTTATLAPGVTLPVDSLATQVAGYLSANGGQADPNALYAVWGGANDLFSITDPATAPGVIGSAVTAEVGIVGALENAGARYVLVATVPDLGLTPAYLGSGQSAVGTQLSTNYNSALFGGLTAAGLRVIPLNTFSLLQEIVADPGTYGFANATTPACGATSALVCNPANFVDPSAASTYVFADGVHPSTAAQAIVAQYAVSVLQAPGQMALLPHSAAVIGRSRADRVGAHLAGKPASDGGQWWTDLRGDFQRYGDGNLYDGAGPTLTAGIDWSAGNVVYGGFAGYGRQRNDWGQRRGNFDQTDTTLGGFLGWYGDNAWINGQLSYSRLAFDTRRDVQLGAATRTHRGSANGRNLSTGISAGWDFTRGALRTGPVASMLSQRIRVGDFAESDPATSTSLAYPQQTFNSLIGSVGWQASWRASDRLMPYARVSWDREFKRYPDQAFAQMQSLPGTMAYAVPGAEFDRSYATLVMGARTQMLGMNANFGVSATGAQRNGNDASVFVTFGNSF